MKTSLVAVIFLGQFVFQAWCGIAGLSAYMRSRYHNSWQSWNTIQNKNAGHIEADHVCIDMNQLLHSSIRVKHAQNISVTLSKLCIEVDSLLGIVRPHKSLVFSFDGAAPFAKMLTQRKRRISRPDGCSISPGTDLMDSMETLMIMFTLQRRYQPIFKNLSIFISDPTLPGEGEIKIIDWINNGIPKVNDSIIICGTDSDIIVQALPLQEKFKNIQIMQFSNGLPDAVCDVSSLFQEIYQSIKYNNFIPNYSQNNNNSNNMHMNTNSDNKSFSISKNQLDPTIDHEFLPNDFSEINPSSLDIVLLCTMQGNDYIPKLRDGVSLGNMMKCFRAVSISKYSSLKFADFNNDFYIYVFIIIIVLVQLGNV